MRLARRRSDPNLRCTGCKLQRNLCICALVPELPTRTRVVLVLHQLETRKPTNTGLLAVRCLPNSEIVLRGRAPDGRDAPPPARLASDLPWQRDPDRCVLLFPHEDAKPIEDFAAAGPLTLVVPDGTWSQAIRARKRIPGLEGLRCATVPPGETTYRLRHDPRPGHLSTLEAIARALGALEGPAVRSELERVLRIMVDRTLWSRGKLDAADVEGGIPRPGGGT
jgi:DTW domain-containing protein YfiP